MPRIDTTDDTAHWRYRCAECGAAHWRANDGTLTCRACSTTGIDLVDTATGETYSRAEIEFIGPSVDWKAPYATGRHR